MTLLTKSSLRYCLSYLIGCADYPRRHFRELVPYGVSTREKQEPSLRENEPTRSRQGSKQQQQQQVQVLLRPTGDFFCLTQFQNQYPELDPGLRLSPVSFPGEGRAPRAAHAAAGAARPFPAPVGLSMAMHMHVRARVYARGWTSAGRGGNSSAAGLVCRPRSARGDRRAATRARMSLEVLALYSHKPAAVLVCSWR